jgi:hypothetical protein
MQAALHHDWGYQGPIFRRLIKLADFECPERFSARRWALFKLIKWGQRKAEAIDEQNRKQGKPSQRRPKTGTARRRPPTCSRIARPPPLVLKDTKTAMRDLPAGALAPAKLKSRAGNCALMHHSRSIGSNGAAGLHAAGRGTSQNALQRTCPPTASLFKTASLIRTASAHIGFLPEKAHQADRFGYAKRPPEVLK